MVDADILIIGSGVGGATLAAALADSGKSILILERGEYLSDGADARSETAIFRDAVFRPEENWFDSSGAAFNPGNYYCVGGNSKFYGAVMLRYRREDFGEQQHPGGVSPAWPITYDDMETWYQKAETLYEVRGDETQDPSEPGHSGHYPFPPIEDETDVARLRKRLSVAGVTPCSLPLAVDIDRWLAGGKTPWDAFPDTNGGKRDAESVCVAAAIQHKNVHLISGARVTQLHTDDEQRISSVDYEKNGEVTSIRAKLVFLGAGAVNSAALLLRSANQANPNGLANSSDMLGRHFMNHNCSALIGVHPLRKNNAIYQKTLYFNDFYLNGGSGDMPLGNVQLLGKISGTILSASTSLPKFVADWVSRHSVDWYVMSEDLPDPESRVRVDGDRIVLNWKRSNYAAHEQLVEKTTQVLKKSGYPIVLSKPFDRRTPSHQCGTARMGRVPASSVVDIHNRSHDHENLFIVDASFLPSSAAVNPALTIAAKALHVADYVKQVHLSS